MGGENEEKAECKKKKNSNHSSAFRHCAWSHTAQNKVNCQGQNGLMDEGMFDQITRYLERVEERLPEDVSNGMLLLALREERAARQRETAAISDKVDEIVRLLKGAQTDGSDGLVQQVAAFDRFRKRVLWALSAVVLAFLGGLGKLVFDLVF